MNEAQRRRLKWVQLYLQCRDAGQVCRRCGISRPTLRKWARRFQSMGEEGLVDLSRRPHNSPARKLTGEDCTSILQIRAQGNGARRIQTELRLHFDRQLSLATIHKVLVAAEVRPLVKPRRPAVPKRYSRPIPGDRVQMDTMKIAPGVYQYTAVDDCSRFRVLGVYPRRNSRNTLLFLDRVIEEMPFAIQRIQTDRGTEFFAESVQERLKEECIKFRPNPPRSPHLNGKVERLLRAGDFRVISVSGRAFRLNRDPAREPLRVSGPLQITCSGSSRLQNAAIQSRNFRTSRTVVSAPMAMVST